MAKWAPPEDNECPQTSICKDQGFCSDICKAREIIKAFVRKEILGDREP